MSTATDNQLASRLQSLTKEELDDIYLNEPMQSFWRSIRLPKRDLTHLGHSSGTGGVFFGR